MARRLTQADQGGTFGEFRGGGDGGGDRETKFGRGRRSWSRRRNLKKEYKKKKIHVKTIKKGKEKKKMSETKD